MQVCVRRNGEVILDRAIGHARGNGPARSRATPRRCSRPPETPFCVYSTSKAVTAFVVHKLCERGLLHLEDPVAEHIPGYERHGKGRSRSATSSPTAPACRTCPREALDLDYIDDREFLLRGPLRRQADRRARHGSSPTTRSPAASSSARSSIGVTGKDIRTVLAEEFLDPLGFRWTNYGVDPADVERGRGQLHHRAAARRRRSRRCSRRALGTRLDELVETTNDPRYLTGHRPGRQH